MKSFVATHYPDWGFYCPQIPLNIASGLEVIEHCLEGLKGSQVGLVGSSLGGYLADWYAQKYHLKAVLINPATRPYESIIKYGDEVEHPHTGEKLTLSTDLVPELIKLRVARRQNPKNYMLLTQTGDETLNYLEALEDLPDVPAIIEAGGDHGFVGFERHLSRICQFLQSSHIE